MSNNDNSPAVQSVVERIRRRTAGTAAERAPEIPVSSTKRIAWSELIGEWERAEKAQIEHNSGSAYFSVLRRIGITYEKIGERAWPRWLAANGVPETRVKRAFHSLIKYLAESNCNKKDGLYFLAPRTGKVVTSKGWVSRLASALDEWNEVARTGRDGEPVRATDIDSWIVSFSNGIDGVCEYRRHRIAIENGEDKSAREPRVKTSQEERERLYRDVLNNSDQPVLPLPDTFAGYDGEYVMAVRLDGATGEMTIRAVWKPDTGFWLRNADKMVPPTMTPTAPQILAAAVNKRGEEGIAEGDGNCEDKDEDAEAHAPGSSGLAASPMMASAAMGSETDGGADLSQCHLVTAHASEGSVTKPVAVKLVKVKKAELAGPQPKPAQISAGLGRRPHAVIRPADCPLRGSIGCPTRKICRRKDACLESQRSMESVAA